MELRACVDSLSKDIQKFFQRNNKAAGVRARKKLQKSKRIAQEIRIMIQQTKQENVQRKSAAISSYAALTGGTSLTGENFYTNTQFQSSVEPNLNCEIGFYPDLNFPKNSSEIYSFQVQKDDRFSEYTLKSNNDQKLGFYPSFDD